MAEEGSGGQRQRVAAILAADVAGYSRLMADDETATIAALDVAREVRAVDAVWQGRCAPDPRLESRLLDASGIGFHRCGPRYPPDPANPHEEGQEDKRRLPNIEVHDLESTGEVDPRVV